MAYNYSSKGSLFLIIIMVILFITFGLVVLSLQSNQVEDYLVSNSVLNVLFVLEKDGLPFSTNVLLYYPELHRSALFDIPANTGLLLSSVDRVDRIDSVYNQKNMADYKLEIEALLGISIPFSVSMDVDEFATVTDLLGGLRVFIPEPVDIADQNENYLLPSGMVLLDGDKVKTFLSYPTPEGIPSDLEERKQQCVLSFFQAINRNNNLFHNEKTFSNIYQFLQTNQEEANSRRLFEYLGEIDAERLVPQTVSGSLRDVDGESLLFPFYDGQLIKDVVKQAINEMVSADGEGQSRIYVLEIQNGTNTPGLARNTSLLYQGFGYDVLNAINADNTDVEETTIINHIGNDQAAQQLADIIMCENVINEEVQPGLEYDQSISLVDFTIILGKDFDGRYVR